MTDDRFWELVDEFEDDTGVVPEDRLTELVETVRHENHDDMTLVEADMGLFNFTPDTKNKLHKYLKTNF